MISRPALFIASAHSKRFSVGVAQRRQWLIAQDSHVVAHRMAPRSLHRYTYMKAHYPGYRFISHAISVYHGKYYRHHHIP